MTRRRLRVASATAAFATAFSLVLAGGALAQRGGPPRNLGTAPAPRLPPPAAKAGFRLDQSALAIRDKQGRVLVDVYAADGSALSAVRRRSEAGGLKVVDQSADHKILEGY